MIGYLPTNTFSNRNENENENQFSYISENRMKGKSFLVSQNNNNKNVLKRGKSGKQGFGYGKERSVLGKITNQSQKPILQKRSKSTKLGLSSKQDQPQNVRIRKTSNNQVNGDTRIFKKSRKNERLLKKKQKSKLSHKSGLKKTLSIKVLNQQQQQQEKQKKKSKPKIYDIDKPFGKNPQYVTEFVQDIYHNKKLKEIEQMTPLDFLSAQNRVTDEMRGILFDWLCGVHLKFELKTEVLYLTCKIVDKFLAKRNVPVKLLQLIGITAMLIASKYEEIYPPEVNDFVYISDKTYSKKEILQAESLILNMLGFRVTFVSPYSFISRYLKAAAISAHFSNSQYLKLKLLANYYLELTIPRIEMIKFKPSQLASAAIFLALKTLKSKNKNSASLKKKKVSQMQFIKNNKKYWTPTLQHYTNFKLIELYDAIKGIHKIISEISSYDITDTDAPLTTRRKYQHSSFGSVSNITLCNL
ncbi:cyclin-a2-4 [Anaeramoeba flamelloides]|uniref:Cyclin-a2-4 n=1 Tax=Anaeramoeba flamelloides TaxID=1746091 RepID=A0AAV7YW75_9EUKA|nr:cyclin-a2-4 [Anaeramoeba flamelloides]